MLKLFHGFFHSAFWAFINFACFFSLSFPSLIFFFFQLVAFLVLIGRMRGGELKRPISVFHGNLTSHQNFPSLEGFSCCKIYKIFTTLENPHGNFGMKKAPFYERNYKLTWLKVEKALFFLFWSLMPFVRLNHSSFLWETRGVLNK